MGFGAADSNLYRYVGNNTTNKTDLNGELSIFFDGTGMRPKDKGVVYRLYSQSKDPKKEYLQFLKNPLNFVSSAGEFYAEVSIAVGMIVRPLFEGPLPWKTACPLEKINLGSSPKRVGNFGSFFRFPGACR
jgi:hypothetical protein